MGGAFAAQDKMIELSSGQELQDITEQYEFALVSFFNSDDPKSVELDGIIELAMKYFDNQIQEGELEKRNVGWFRVDSSKVPELGGLEENVQNDQIIFNGQERLQRSLQIGSIEDDQSLQKKSIAAIVAELTGEFVIQTECEDIQHQNRVNYDEVIYFGAKANLEKDGKAAALS